MKKIVLTGGGTAGHVTPHLALLPKLKNKFEIHYIGSNGIEKDIMKKYPYVIYHEITTVKLVRSLTPKNLLIPFKLLKGIKESKNLIKEIKPSVIFSKGGFVAVPVVFASHKLNIPIISHESDLTLGLANKLILNKCNVMCCSFEKTAQSCPNKCLYTGTPIRQELFLGNKEIANQKCKFKNLQKPCILVMGGSLGAKAINKIVLEALPELTKTYNVIHIVGKGNLSNTKQDSYYECEFVSDIEHYFALSNFVVSRAGSNSINEFLALQKPMILIPLPKDASRGDQILNAQEFKKHNYCLVLDQEKLTKTTLINNINALNNKKQEYVNTLKNAKALNATETIYNIILKYSM